MVYWLGPAYKALLLSIRYRPKHRIKRAGNNKNEVKGSC
nr:MAG TPA: hypothetical protein [Caudoviricetes sp.]